MKEKTDAAAAVAMGERIREERERLAMTQAAFAELAGATGRSQIGWEQGAATPKPKALEAWANAGADIVYIITGDRMPVDRSVTWSLFSAAYIDQVRLDGDPEEMRQLKNVAFMELAKRAPTKEEFLLLASYRRLDADAKKMVSDLVRRLSVK